MEVLIKNIIIYYDLIERVIYENYKYININNDFINLNNDFIEFFKDFEKIIHMNMFNDYYKLIKLRNEKRKPEEICKILHISKSQLSRLSKEIKQISYAIASLHNLI